MRLSLAEEIAKHTGVSVPTVRRVISGYNRLGPVALETPGKGGRHHEYLTVEQERELLAPFFACAQRGELATAGEIKRAFEAQVGARSSMKAPSIACCIDMGGASWFRVRAIDSSQRGQASDF